MNPSKRGSCSSAWCEVCHLQFGSEADFALHQFSKKHCDNLIRVSKNKPVIVKPKPVPIEKPKPSQFPEAHFTETSGVITKYGYFVPGEHNPSEVADAYDGKEYNYEYDPYLQKLAENPYKEKPQVSLPQATTLAQAALGLPTTNITSFSKRKKKKIRTCQICNVILTTVPEYETHMKSPQHVWKLKLSGMGVSAHFVRASTDLHTTEVNEEDDNSNLDQPSNSQAMTCTTAPSTSTPSLFPSHFCDVCDVLLNSEAQYAAHIKGKIHNDCVKKKNELQAKKDKLENPLPDQLYCYSCQIILNNLFQYNEHKNGKKHKIRCKQLMQHGVTIPPEERIASLPAYRNLQNKPVVYPKLYEKFLAESQKKATAEAPTVQQLNTNQAVEQNKATDVQSGMNPCNKCNLKFNTLCNHLKPSDNLIKQESQNKTSCVGKKADGMFVNPGLTMPNKPNNSSATTLEGDIKQTEKPDAENTFQECTSCNLSFHLSQSREHFDSDDHKAREKSRREAEQIRENQAKQNQPANKETIEIRFQCNVCSSTYNTQVQSENHLQTEEHAKKVIELKKKGTTAHDLMSIMYKDKLVVKPDRRGCYLCSICSVTSNNLTEHNQHLSGNVHKLSEKDYKKRRLMEVQQSVDPDSNGKYTCGLCKVTLESIIAFNQHINTLTHKYTHRAELVRKLTLKRRAMLNNGRKSRYFVGGIRKTMLWCKKYERNPGIRTKVGGKATDLSTGAVASIPNLEPLEPKIDVAKNVQIGVAIKKTPETSKEKKMKREKTRNSIQRMRSKFGNCVQQMTPRLGNYQMRGPRFPDNRQWNEGPPPFPNHGGNQFSDFGYQGPARHPYPDGAPGPFRPILPNHSPHRFPGRPPFTGPYQRPFHPYNRPPFFEQAPWSRFRDC